MIDTKPMTVLHPPIHPSCRCTVGLKFKPMEKLPEKQPEEQPVAVPTALEMIGKLAEARQQIDLRLSGLRAGLAELRAEKWALYDEIDNFRNRDDWVDLIDRYPSLAERQLIDKVGSASDKAVWAQREALNVKLERVEKKCQVTSLKIQKVEQQAAGKFREILNQRQGPSTVEWNIVGSRSKGDTDRINDAMKEVASIVGDKNDLLSKQKVLVFKIKKNQRNQRAYCIKDAIWIPEAPSSSTIAHEMGHVLEHQNKSVYEAAVEFLNRRTSGEALVDLHDLYDGAYEKGKEFTKVDKFDKLDGLLRHSAYVGKSSAKATEIISRGLEAMYLDPAKFAELDSEYFTFMYNLLRGLP